MLPKLVETSNSQTKPVRIITVSSQFHSYGILPYNFDEIKNGKSGGYGLSKLANIHFSKELSNQLKQAGLSDKIHTYSLHPGFVSTGIWGTSNWGWYLKPIEFLFHLFLTTEEDGAATTLYCTLDDQCEKESGLYYDQCKVAEPLPSAKDETAMKELWEHSLKLTGAKWKLK